MCAVRDVIAQSVDAELQGSKRCHPDSYCVARSAATQPDQEGHDGACRHVAILGTHILEQIVRGRTLVAVAHEALRPDNNLNFCRAPCCTLTYDHRSGRDCPDGGKEQCASIALGRNVCPPVSASLEWVALSCRLFRHQTAWISPHARLTLLWELLDSHRPLPPRFTVVGDVAHVSAIWHGSSQPHTLDRQVSSPVRLVQFVDLIRT